MINKKLLEDLRHELTTLHGLHATDGFSSYGDALTSGCDAPGAWDCFVSDCFKLDFSSLLKRIDEELARPWWE